MLLILIPMPNKTRSTPRPKGMAGSVVVVMPEDAPVAGRKLGGTGTGTGVEVAGAPAKDATCTTTEVG